MEKDLVGFYVSSHPLTERKSEVEAFGIHTTRSLQNAQQLPEGSEAILAGMITSVKTRIGKSGRSEGKKWAIVEFEDLDGKVEGMVFADMFADLTTRDPELVKADRVVLVRGKVDRKREVPCLVVNDISPLEEAALKMTEAVIVRVDATYHTPAIVEQIKPLLGKYKGGIETYVAVTLPDGRRLPISLAKEFRVRPVKEFVDEATAILGPNQVELIGPGTRRKKRDEQQRLFAEQQASENKAPDTDEALVALADAEME
jgi:DNA polymerase III subunit alpha